MFDHCKNGIIDPRFRQFIHLFLIQFFERSMAINTTFQLPIEIIKFVISITMDICIPVLDAYTLNKRFFINIGKIMFGNRLRLNFRNWLTYGEKSANLIKMLPPYESCSGLLMYILSIIVELKSLILVGRNMWGRNPKEVIVLRKSEYLLLEAYLRRSILKSPDR